MGRWRPPQPASSPYITAQGKETLEQELTDLWKRRADVVKALSAAAAEGDRSENAEYIYRKKELGGLDRRIRFLQKRIPNVQVVERQSESDKVYFGAWVELEDHDGEIVTYRIVGADETSAPDGYISIDSPMARALLGKQVDDDIRLTVGDRKMEYFIAGIRYHNKD